MKPYSEKTAYFEVSLACPGLTSPRLKTAFQKAWL